MSDIGVAAASELGVELERLALIPDPGAEIAAVLSALVDGIDLVVLGQAVGPWDAAAAGAPTGWEGP
ncbi:MULTISPECIES: hypothetical protein [Amycolatopsis]|uniref:Uncharacterized protein n=1 Tax=Amycolatopsis bullii TaxID=941987 RepID=A0ABQ3KSU3_9PSEU|nr:hypothetical protein [Amycolatopsis bullii]GHG42753.1 hypothetical protein GCM10017567_75830 [Amycolatopsis bullii]